MANAEPKKYEHEYDPGDKIDILALELERKLSETIADRNTIDTRMVEDLRNYHGMYDPKTLEVMESNDTAKVFIKLTRAKTNAGEAQLVDLLFPNDDKNWGIKATPKPTIVDMLNDKDTVFKLGETQYQHEDGTPVTNADVADRAQEQAKEACLKMETLIEDQLVETKYNAKCRDIIHDACVVGTGVIKGPIVLGKTDRAYVQDKQTGEFATVIKQTFEPGCEVVRPWDFYPDMSASSIEEAEFVFERRYLSKKQLRGLVRKKGFKQDRINKVLKMTSIQTQHRSSYVDDIRIMAGLSDTLNDTRYETWEYHGPISADVLEQLEVVEAIDPDDESYVDEYEAVVFYCGGVVMGARLSLMDYTEAMPYRVYNWELDDSSIFGYGVPRMVRDEQAIINSTWRMILDNGSVTSGPQIGVNKKLISPQDGKWDLRPRKFWNVEGTTQDIKQAFSTFEFNSHINELSMIYNTARVLFDEVSGVPMIQQGEQGQSTQTLGGMSMLMNAANTVRRNQVKQWDDFVTEPLIKDFYHFNMMHSDDNDVKGDYQVDARGTSALLVKEQVGQALMNFINIAGNSPVFAPVMKLKAVQLLKEFINTQGLPKSIVPTDEELAKYQKDIDEQSQNQPQDPAIQIETMRQQAAQQKYEFEMQLEQAKAALKQAEMQANYELKSQQIAADMQNSERQERIEIMKLAQNDKINNEKMLVELEKVKNRAQLEWDKFMAEYNIKKQAGLTANYGLA